VIGNTVLGWKVYEYAKDHPEEFDMDYWVYKQPCGTTACLAGHTLILSGYRIGESGRGFWRPDGTLVSQPGREAQYLLELDINDRYFPDDLFSMDCEEAALERFHDLLLASDPGARP
jgi:hypothetical protein